MKNVLLALALFAVAGAAYAADCCLAHGRCCRLHQPCCAAQK